MPDQPFPARMEMYGSRLASGEGLRESDREGVGQDQSRAAAGYKVAEMTRTYSSVKIQVERAVRNDVRPPYVMRRRDAGCGFCR